MDLDKIRKILSLAMMAVGIFALIFIAYSIVVISKIAQNRGKHEIQKDYAGERISPSPTSVTGPVRR